MDPLGIVRELWRHKIYLAIVFVLAAIFAILSAYKVTSSGLEKRSLQVGAASSQILVDSPGSALVAGASVGTFDALSTRAQIYGQYLSSLEARAKIAKLTGVPASTIATAGPFSTDVAQNAYSGQSSTDRANQLVDQGAPNRLVFTAQEGVPIITVDSQAPTANRAAKLAVASFTVLKRYVHRLKSSKEYLADRQIGPQRRGQGRAEGRDRARARHSRGRDDRRRERQDPHDPRLRHRVPARLRGDHHRAAGAGSLAEPRRDRARRRPGPARRHATAPRTARVRPPEAAHPSQGSDRLRERRAVPAPG